MAIGGVLGSAVLNGLSKVVTAKLKEARKPAGSAPAAPPSPQQSGGIKKSLGDALGKLGLDVSKLDANAGGVRAFAKELFSKLQAQGQGSFEADLKSLTSKLDKGEGGMEALKEKFNALATALGGASTASLQGMLHNLQAGEELKGRLISTAA